MDDWRKIRGATSQKKQNEKNLMPPDVTWQASRSSVETKTRWWHQKSNKSSLNRPPFTPDNYFGWRDYQTIPGNQLTYHGKIQELLEN